MMHIAILSRNTFYPDPRAPKEPQSPPKGGNRLPIITRIVQ